MTSIVKRALSCDRGTASVEAVMLLPFLITAYAALYWVHGHYTARQQAQAQARSCAWAYAKSGCRDDAVPAECRSASEQSRNESDTWSGGDGARYTEEVADESGLDQLMSVVDAISEIPLIGDAVSQLFGIPAYSRQTHVTRVTPRFAPQERRIAGTYFTLCNTQPADWGTVAERIFCEIVGSGFPGCS